MSAAPPSPLHAPEAARSVAIGDLLRDPRFQVRQRLDLAMVDRYARVIASGVIMPPIVVAMVAGVPVVVDGWHRVSAHERLGIGTIEARFVEATVSEARWLAAHANITHGLPLKPREVRTAFKAFIRARRHLGPVNRKGTARSIYSYRDIAREMGGLVSHHTIRNWMIRDFPKIASCMGGEAAPSAEPPGPDDPQEGFVKAAQDALATALAASRGVIDPERRGQLVQEADRTAKAIREAGPWQLDDEF
jgi:hypothetical protein